MPVALHCSRIDTLKIKSQIERKLGRLKAEKYFDLLSKFLSYKISKPDFDGLCTGVIGRENVPLHNHFLRSIIKNAHISKTPPPKDSKVEGSLSVKVPNGYRQNSLPSLCRNFPQSPRRGRTLSDRKFKDRPSPLGPHGKSHGIAKNREQLSPTELLSLGSKLLGSVEDGEEVDQEAGSLNAYCRSPVKAPLGIPLCRKVPRKLMFNCLASSHPTETCCSSGELPDTTSLRKRLEQKLTMEGINVSADCANLLNKSLDVYLKRLIKDCLDLANSRSGQKNVGQGHGHAALHGLNGMWPVRYAQKQCGLVSASMSDFRVAMELNPSILGEEWPIQLEKICLRASEE